MDIRKAPTQGKPVTTASSHLKDSPTNHKRRQQAMAALLEAIEDACEPGFYGTATIEVTVNNGTIQHIRRRLERLDKL